jgi:hypothetical protein
LRSRRQEEVEADALLGGGERHSLAERALERPRAGRRQRLDALDGDTAQVEEPQERAARRGDGEGHGEHGDGGCKTDQRALEPTSPADATRDGSRKWWSLGKVDVRTERTEL